MKNFGQLWALVLATEGTESEANSLPGYVLNRAAEGVGVEHDDVRAYALLYTALKIGLPAGLRAASYDLLGRLAARLSGAELPRAHELSREISAAALQDVRPVLQR